MKTEQIKLSSETREQLIEARADLLSRIEAIETQNKITEAIEKKIEQLRRQIEKGERDLDPVDDNAVALLSAKRVQLTACERKLATGEAEEGTTPDDLRRAMSSACDVLNRLLQSEFERVLAETESLLAPLFDLNADANRAKHFARQTDKILNFGGFLQFRVAQVGSPDACRTVCGMIADVLAGQNPWRWNP